MPAHKKAIENELLRIAVSCLKKKRVRQRSWIFKSAIRCGAVLTIAQSCQPTLAAQMTDAPTIKQALDMHFVLAPAISPDGSKVAYEQTRTKWQDNEFYTGPWIADVR